jgi:membrane-associated protease RseP (regulator of RpoE activity)
VTYSIAGVPLAINLLPFPSLDGGQLVRAVWRMRRV